MNMQITKKKAMAGVSKIVSLMVGIIVFGALATTAFGYFSNITSALASYPWASTLITLGIVIGCVYMFIPQR
jgi:hypothetical protein